VPLWRQRISWISWISCKPGTCLPIWLYRSSKMARHASISMPRLLVFDGSAFSTCVHVSTYVNIRENTFWPSAPPFNFYPLKFYTRILETKCGMQFFLFVIKKENFTSILRSNIRALSIKCSRIMHFKKLF